MDENIRVLTLIEKIINNIEMTINNGECMPKQPTSKQDCYKALYGIKVLLEKTRIDRLLELQK